MSWRDSVLEDLAFFQRGYDITKKEQRPGPYPVVSSSGVKSFHAEYKSKGPGVVIGRKGTLGTVHYLGGDYWPHDTTLWVRDFKGNVPRFVFYFVHTLAFERFDVGGANPTLNRNHIHGLPIKIPALPDQQRIADILSAYDDLIENNNRRMALVEEAIHLLYREWFVYLRFPGHERTEITDGVPDGWEKREVKDAFSYLGGGTPSRKRPELWDGGAVDWYSPTDLTQSGSFFMERSKEQINDLGLAQSSAKLFPAWSVMFTSRATIGALAINTGPATTNQGFINCIPNDRVPLYFLYCWLKANTEGFIARATGSTFKELSKGKFGAIPVLLPAQQLVREFNDVVEPLAEQILTLQRQNTKLREARDLLLPRLMDGRTPV